MIINVAPVNTGNNDSATNGNTPSTNGNTPATNAPAKK
jgi:hypothetical protein